MQEAIKKIPDLGTSLPEEWRSSLDPEVALSAIEFTSSLEKGSFDYNNLVLTLCDQAKPFLRRIQSHGYQPWLFLVGPIMNADMQLRFPNYALSNALEKCGVSIASSSEKVYWLESGRRVVGLYSIEWDSLPKCIHFLTKNSWAIGIFSEREEFALTEGIEIFYNSSSKHDNNMISMDINWVALAENTCPSGDVLLKTVGAFDDSDRMLKLIFSPQKSYVFEAP